MHGKQIIEQKSIVPTTPEEESGFIMIEPTTAALLGAIALEVVKSVIADVASEYLKREIFGKGISIEDALKANLKEVERIINKAFENERRIKLEQDVGKLTRAMMDFANTNGTDSLALQGVYDRSIDVQIDSKLRHIGMGGWESFTFATVISVMALNQKAKITGDKGWYKSAIDTIQDAQNATYQGGYQGIGSFREHLVGHTDRRITYTFEAHVKLPDGSSREDRTETFPGYSIFQDGERKFWVPGVGGMPETIRRVDQKCNEMREVLHKEVAEKIGNKMQEVYGKLADLKEVLRGRGAALEVSNNPDLQKPEGFVKKLGLSPEKSPKPDNQDDLKRAASQESSQNPAKRMAFTLPNRK